MAKALARREGLTAQEREFVRYLALNGDPEAAAECSGSTQYDKKLAARRYLASAHIALALQIEMRRQLAMDAPRSFRVLREIRDDPMVSEKVRADCAKTLLDRAGHIAPKAAPEKGGEQPLHEMSTDELRALAGRLEDEIADRAKDVSSATAAPPALEDVDLVG